MSSTRSINQSNKGVQDDQRKILVAAAVAAIPAIWLGYKAFKRLSRKVPPAVESECEQWTTEQVAQWMTTKKFSPACVKAFVKFEVDGTTLLWLGSTHLAEMGVTKLKDRILFERLVEPLRKHAAKAPKDKESEEEEEDERAETAPKTADRDKDTLVRNATEKDPESQEMKKVMVALMQQLQGIYRVCSSNEFLHGSPDTQRKTLAISKQQLNEVKTVTAMLPAVHQNAVAPLINSLSQLMDKVEEGLQQQAEHQQQAPQAPRSEAAPQLDERTKASLATLQTMLKGFTDSICSDEAAALPAEEKHRLTENIRVQVAKILQALNSLPPVIAQPIIAQCHEVLRLSEELLNRPTAGHGQARGQRLGAQAPPPAESATAQQSGNPVQRASLEFLVSRLRAVFDALRSPKTLELHPEPRLQLIEKMENDIAKVAEEAAHLPTQDQQILVQVLQNVVQVVQQIKMITLEEQKLRALKEGGKPEEKTAAAPEAPSQQQQQSQLSMEQVSTAIRGVLTMLKSPKFAEAPREVQRQIAARMQQQLANLGEGVKEVMGPAEQQHLLPMITKVSQLVEVAAAQASKEPAAPTPAAAEQAVEVDEDFLKIVATLKQVFEMVNSAKFQEAPATTRQAISKELLQHVRSVEQTSASLAPPQRNAVQEMISPLIRLLTAVSSMPAGRGEQQQPQQQQREAPKPQPVQEDEDEEGEGQSTAFSAIISSLQEVFEVVNSDGFKNAPLKAQQEVAGQLNDHVRTLSSHFSKLTAQERATALRFVTPLKELLEAILGQKSEAPSARTTGTQSNTADQEEEGTEEDENGVKATYAVISKLQKLYAVAQSDNFIHAAPAQKQRIASMIRAELDKLERETTALPSEQRMQVIPLIRQLGQLLANFAPESFVEEVEEEEEEGKEENDDEQEAVGANEQDLEDRAALFERAVDAVMLMRSRTINVEELQEMLELLDELDTAGISSQQEITIRQALHTAIKQSIRNIQKEQGLEVDEEDEEEEPQTQVSNNGNQKGKQEEEKEVTPKSGEMFNLTRFFQAMLQLLKSADLKNTRQLIPFTERIEAALSDADNQGIPWRRDPATFRAVTDVLTEVQAIQQKLQANGPSEIEQLLRTATADVLKDKPSTIPQLSPYLELLDQLAKMQDQMTIEDLEAYQELQKAVILVRDGILSRQKKSPSSSLQNSPSARSKDEKKTTPTDLASPMFTTAAPPNTPAAHIQDPPSLHDDEDEEVEEIEEGEEEEGDADEDGEETTQEDAMIGEMLFQIYQKLQRQRHTNEQLAPFERVIQQLRAKKTNSRVTQILDAVEELLERHRAVNDEEMNNALKEERKKAETMLRDETARQSPSSADKKQAPPTESPKKESAPPAAAAPEPSYDEDEAADAASEGIVDGLSNQLALLPRLLERLQLPDFMESTTLFEIQCIGRILVHLKGSRMVARNPDLREAVERANQMFGQHVQSFQGSVKDDATVTCAMKLTGMALELENHEHLTQYTIIGAEEEEYTVNEPFVAKLDGNALEVGQPAKGVEDQWKANSRCIIFSIQQYPDGPENATSLSELTMLVDALDVHGFDITSVPSEGITAQDAADVIRSVLNERPSRLLVYYYTPFPQSIASEMHAVTFADGTTLAHRDVAAMCKGLVERAVIVHDQTRRLEVAAARDGVLGSYVSIALTEGAAQIANTSRCWLFDGVFTPAVVQTISNHSNGYLCPEELITGPLGQLTGRTISQGSFSDEPALKMAFFAPQE